MNRPSTDNLPHHGSEGDDSGATSSVRTVKGAAEEKSDAPPTDKLETTVTEPKSPTMLAIDPRPLSPTKITPATLASPVTSPIFPPSAFTHRFTIVKPIGALNKPPAAPARKGSSQAQSLIGWAFSAAGLTTSSGGNSSSGGASSGGGKASKKKAKLPKCEVCRFKVKGAGAHLRCDDCNCQ